MCGCCTLLAAAAALMPLMCCFRRGHFKQIFETFSASGVVPEYACDFSKNGVLGLELVLRDKCYQHSRQVLQAQPKPARDLQGQKRT
jgi:hypothetical protein